MGKLASGVGIAKGIGLLTMPAITRIYTPDEFGVLSVFVSSIILIVPLTTLLYPITIPLPKHDGLALNIAVLSGSLILTVVSILAVVFYLFGESIFGFFNMTEIARYWWLLALAIFAASFYELLAHWATRVKAFAEIAKTKVWQAMISAFLKIVLGALGFKPIGLLIGDAAQRGGGVVTLIKAFKEDIKKNIHLVTIKRIRFLASYYIDLPKFRLPSQFLLKLSGQVPVLFFAFQFGQEETGQLGLSLAMIGLPMTLLGSTTGKAYYAEIAKVGPKRSSEILRITKSVTKRLFVLSLIPCIVLIFAAPLLFRIVFGAEWEQAGIFTSIMAIYLLFQFVTSPLMNVFTVYNLQFKFLQINVIRGILMIIIFGVSFLFNMNVYNTLIIYVAILSSYYVVIGFQIKKVLNRQILKS